MLKPLTHISVSSIQHYQDDPLTWCYTWLENRVPRKTGTAVSTGRLVHKAFENHFKGGGRVGDELDALLAPIDPRYLDERARKAYYASARLVEPLNLWEDRYPIDRTLEVEAPFEEKLPNGLIFQGRPDRVVSCYGKVWHFQHKTLAASRNPEHFIKLAPQSMHELLYAAHLRQKYTDEPYGGSIYNVVRKLKYKSEAKGPKFGTILNDINKLFIQRHFALRDTDIARARVDLLSLALKMERLARDYTRYLVQPPRNRRFDAGFYGTGLNPYLPVILGETTLDDDSRYMDRLDPYEAIAEEEEE